MIRTPVGARSLKGTLDISMEPASGLSLLCPLTPSLQGQDSGVFTYYLFIYHWLSAALSVLIPTGLK